MTATLASHILDAIRDGLAPRSAVASDKALKLPPNPEVASRIQTFKHLYRAKITS